jgi:hypothetical protein
METRRPRPGGNDDEEKRVRAVEMPRHRDPLDALGQIDEAGANAARAHDRIQALDEIVTEQDRRITALEKKLRPFLESEG